MTDEIARAREEMERAGDEAESNVREPLMSLSEGLMEVVGGDKTQDTRPHDDRLREVEHRLDELEEEAEGSPRERIRRAKALIADYRQDAPTEE
ncbi:DUF7553 family protein [Halopelagius longus]|uniref:Uncharacterized protein n=1 Tax=Halopelagius longus TaxID=1236180 RepID=A0A1H1GLN9_9EURY|nr:hypothetical protein [Halopelagius longus]RDI69680.1 hypothetical protein DWB78_18085 [Halopelagius longus]SDR13786.1 hypothetical protein SAMN05216278_3737 [Halopelagius longus]